MMSLLWYYRPEHLQGGRSPSMHEPLQNEVFASRHQDQNSVACIEEKCYVLTFAEYCSLEGFHDTHSEEVPSYAEFRPHWPRGTPADGRQQYGAGD